MSTRYSPVDSLSQGARLAIAWADAVQPVTAAQYMASRGVGGRGQPPIKQSDLMFAFGDVSAALSATMSGEYNLDDTRRAFQLSQLQLELLRAMSEKSMQDSMEAARKTAAAMAPVPA